MNHLISMLVNLSLAIRYGPERSDGTISHGARERFTNLYLVLSERRLQTSTALGCIKNSYSSYQYLVFLESVIWWILLENKRRNARKFAVNGSVKKCTKLHPGIFIFAVRLFYLKLLFSLGDFWYRRVHL